jgi:hypothetical protein
VKLRPEEIATYDQAGPDRVLALLVDMFRSEVRRIGEMQATANLATEYAIQGWPPKAIDMYVIAIRRLAALDHTDGAHE